MNYFRRIPILMIFVAAGCTPANTAKPAADTAVKTEVPTRRTMRLVIEQPATIEGFQEALLVAHVSGYVKSVDADIGKPPAKKGDTLAEINVPELLQEYEQKKALVQQASAEVDQAKAALAAAETNIKSMMAQVTEYRASQTRAAANFERWKSEYSRVEKLVSEKVIDPQIAAETLNQYRSANASKQEAEAKVDSTLALTAESEAKRDKARADVTAAEARVRVAKAEEGKLKAMTDYRFIKAPFDGVVMRRFVHPGAFLQPNASGGLAPVFHFAQIDTLRIVIDIPEADAKYFASSQQQGLLEALVGAVWCAQRQPATIQIPALKGPALPGHVARVSEALDPKTRTLRVEIDHANPDKKLLPGTFATVRFELAFADRLTLPASAIFIHADQPCCWRDVNGKAVRTPVKLGLRDGPLVEVLMMQRDSTWGAVKGDERVVVANLGAVREGKDLQVKSRSGSD